MKRYTFYFAVGLLAFGFGSMINLLDCNVPSNLPNNNLINDSQSESNKDFLENKKPKQPEVVEIKLKDLPCEDKILKLVWNKFSNEIISTNSESAEDFKDCSDIIEWFEPDDLNSDGQKEIFIRGIRKPFRCGNGCSNYWIFEKINGQDYRKIFEAEGYLPVIRKTKTLGYRNITFEFDASDVEFNAGAYKFNGTEYILKNCSKESKLFENKDGELVEGKKWKIIHRKCNE